MKKLILTLIIILIIGSGVFLYFTKENKSESIPPEKTNVNLNQENTNVSKEPEYIDNNPINLGLYKYYGRNKDRELITEYSAPWTYHQDISSFEVFYTNEKYINSKFLKTTFDEYKNTYNSIDNYKIGFIINFQTPTKEINKTILSPKDTEEFFDILEIYLYDDYHRQNGVWYSHTTEEEYNDDTLLTSLKLTAGKNIQEITSDIHITAFTYDADDFDESGLYQGKSKYTITVKKS